MMMQLRLVDVYFFLLMYLNWRFRSTHTLPFFSPVGRAGIEL